MAAQTNEPLWRVVAAVSATSALGLLTGVSGEAPEILARACSSQSLHSKRSIVSSSNNVHNNTYDQNNDNISREDPERGYSESSEAAASGMTDQTYEALKNLQRCLPVTISFHDLSRK